MYASLVCKKKLMFSYPYETKKYKSEKFSYLKNTFFYPLPLKNFIEMPKTSSSYKSKRINSFLV